MAETEPVEPHEAASHLFRSGARNPGVSGIRSAAVSSGTRPAISVTLEPANKPAAAPKHATPTEGKVATIQSRHILWMAFGLPLMTAAISMGSMYLGHLITTQSDRPTNVVVQPAQSAVQVNVPQAKPPVIEVRPSEAQVQVHVPQSAPPTVTVTTPQAAPPNITVNPPPATVTVIERKEESEKASADKSGAVAPGPAAATNTSTNTSTTTAPATPAGDASKLNAPKGNGSSYLPPVHETRPLVNVSSNKPAVALGVTATEPAQEDDTLKGDVLPRSPAEIARQQADDDRRKK
jgi:hypothetical protein